MSKLCRAACRVVVEVVVAKLDNWRRAILGKAVFKLNRKNGFGQLHKMSQDEPDSPIQDKPDSPRRRSKKRIRPSLVGGFFLCFSSC